MRTFIATLCLAVVFATEKKTDDVKMLTCAEFTKKVKDSCTEVAKLLKDDKKEKEAMTKCTKGVEA